MRQPFILDGCKWELWILYGVVKEEARAISEKQEKQTGDVVVECCEHSGRNRTKGEKVVNLWNRPGGESGKVSSCICDLLIVKKAKYPFALPSIRLW